jgi:23S rRNA pseudouridine2457 synthase
MARLLILNKPYGVLCQFSDASERATLKDFLDAPGVYPAGRLDRDSEGLVVLTDDGALQARIADPRHKMEKRYWAQVEGMADEGAMARLRGGVDLSDGPARATLAKVIEEPPGLWPRDPPVRVRRRIPTSWIEIGLREGRNRQVRRMTAAVGLPTLRLIRHRIGDWTLGALLPGQWREILSTPV